MVQSSVQFSCSVSCSVQLFATSWTMQQARLPCLSPIPGAYSNSCPSSQWCHPTISSSVTSFFSRLQFFPASGSLPMSQFFTSDSQSIGTLTSAWVLPMNIQNWFPLGWTAWISLQSKGHIWSFDSQIIHILERFHILVNLYFKPTHFSGNILLSLFSGLWSCNKPSHL